MEWIAHYGTKEHSGRYKWGSGDRPYQRLENTKQGVAAIKSHSEYSNLQSKYNATFDAKKAIDKTDTKKVRKQIENAAKDAAMKKTIEFMEKHQPNEMAKLRKNVKDEKNYYKKSRNFEFVYDDYFDKEYTKLEDKMIYGDYNKAVNSYMKSYNKIKNDIISNYSVDETLLNDSIGKVEDQLYKDWKKRK